MKGVDKYAREVAMIGNRVNAMIREAQVDEDMSPMERQDTAWELVRIRETLAQSTASLVALAIKDDDL